jgi:predicted nucleotidyltransferase
MANSGKKTAFNENMEKGKISSVQKALSDALLTDGYQILDALSINNKLPFEELLKVIKDSILESVGKDYIKTIYLFGSRAYGKPTKYSDIDVCVVLSNKINKSKAYFAISRGLSNKKIVSLDILVYNEREFNDRKNTAGIVKTIYMKGRALYG